MFYLIGENNEYPVLNMNANGEFTPVNISIGDINIIKLTNRINGIVAEAGGEDKFLQYYPIAVLNMLKLDTDLITSNYKDAVNKTSILIAKLFCIDIMKVVYSNIRFYQVKDQVHDIVKNKYITSLETTGILMLANQDYYTDNNVRKLVLHTTQELRYFVDKLVFN